MVGVSPCAVSEDKLHAQYHKYCNVQFHSINRKKGRRHVVVSNDVLHRLQADVTRLL